MCFGRRGSLNGDMTEKIKRSIGVVGATKKANRCLYKEALGQCSLYVIVDTLWNFW